MRYFFVSFTVLLTTICLRAAAPQIFLDIALSKAKFVGLVQVVKYDTIGHIQFRSLEYTDTIVGAQIAYRRGPDGFMPKGMNSLFYSDYFPFIGDTILAIVDSSNWMSICAVVIGNNYRFWCFNSNMNVPCFWYKAPAFRLPGEDYGLPAFNGYERCLDGCLLPIEALRTYGKED